LTPLQCEEIAKFDAFNQADTSTTRRYGGTGLGLRISYFLAGMLGGAIDIISEAGVGSEFTATIDMGRGVQAGAGRNDSGIGNSGMRFITQEAEKTNEMPLSGLRVLLAEDSPDLQRLFTIQLSRAGAEVVTVDDGRDALDTYLGEEENWFDLILLDMQMPILDGYEAAKELRNHNCKTPILAVTAHATAGARQKCIDAGCDDYLTKPVIKAELIKACRALAIDDHVRLRAS